jgi:hypothetical protein
VQTTYATSKKQATDRTTEIPVNFHRSERRCTPQDNALQNSFFDKGVFLLKAHMRRRQTLTEFCEKQIAESLGWDILQRPLLGVTMVHKF